jgi:hypothetical protein
MILTSFKKLHNSWPWEYPYSKPICPVLFAVVVPCFEYNETKLIDKWLYENIKGQYKYGVNITHFAFNNGAIGPGQTIGFVDDTSFLLFKLKFSEYIINTGTLKEKYR